MIAENLTDAYNNFNVNLDAEPLQCIDFYVDREGNPFQDIKYDLLKSKTHDKILFTGHLGCGKSTELNRLSADWEIENKFFI
ncbi:MAG: hypothetical protein ACE5GM_01175, partial [bacterium]